MVDFFPPQILDLFNFLNPIFSEIFSPIWGFIKSWWWLPLPFILWKFFSFLWLWWRGIDVWFGKQTIILLEVKIPKEILKPIRAMETVMEGIYQVFFEPINSWKKWVSGVLQLSCSFEIASIGGDVHFFLRIPKEKKDPIESLIYSQYPEVEISVVDDYTKHVPADIPNKDWDLWGCDYQLLKEDAYPIKTYKKFETEKETKEEKKIDPLAGLLEGMAKIKPGEQFWVQITAGPEKTDDWIKEGKKLRDELARRTKKPAPRKSIISEAIDVLISGKVAGEAKEEKEDSIPVEMKLTPGERDVIAGVEDKISKMGFITNIRFIYLGKRSVFYTPNFKLGFGFFNSFSTRNLNGLRPVGNPSMTRVNRSLFLPINLVRKRRIYLRKRAIFRKYKSRVSFYFPRSGGTFILNSEELATLFHFSGQEVSSAPSVSRIEAKKGQPPAGLPTEEL
jgi:hypothetical protein